MDVQHIYDAGLCELCGTCVGVCPEGAISMAWDLDAGYVLRVDRALCTDCGTCIDVCPGDGFDYSDGAWWRERNGDAPRRDFLGPWRTLHFGWASDPDVRHAGASGGVATAILQGALAHGLIDAAVVIGMDPDNALAGRALLARSADEVAAARGSKYTTINSNVLLRTVREEPGRYAVVGLPCHLQGLRRAQKRLPVLRERVGFALGIFCGLTNLPRATWLAARRAGVDPDSITSVGYRGPGWPGGLRLTSRSGTVKEVPYPDYHDGFVGAWVPLRCRLCPDALAELADVSVGDAWLDRFSGTPGVSDLIVRTEAGERFMEEIAPDRLTLEEATPDEMVASQRETYHVKRDVMRGRLWLRRKAGRAAPDYPGLDCVASPTDKVAGIRDLAREAAYRSAGRLLYR
ncbi:MAG TPA: Coenzyme F420 hydrogenase/dehydrogenase, beta subunit C-terminal domain [Thermoleophilia bacterium]|nr:Coenzyme F420 hydrogenase/dehydrogenase, beta subunit C-terminal domain [Thermoleophilia bacterium]